MRVATSRAAPRVHARAAARPPRGRASANSPRHRDAAGAAAARARTARPAVSDNDRDVSSRAPTTSSAARARAPTSEGRAREAEGNGARGDDATTREENGSTSWDDGDDDGGGGDDASNGRGGDGDGADDAGDGSADAAASWARADRRRARAASDGGALFAGVVSTMLAPVAWVVFRGIKPTRAEREKYAMETREAETLAKRRAKRETAAAKVAKRLDEADDATKATKAVTTKVDATETAEAVMMEATTSESEEAATPATAPDEQTDASKRSDVDAEDDQSVATSTSSEEVATNDDVVRVVSVSERAFETPEAESAVVPTPTASRDDEPIIERRQGDHEEHDVIADHPKLVRAIHEANALVHRAHARRIESNEEFQDALRYRQQVVQMASDLGIPVAPLREVKETFKQSTYEVPLGSRAGENATKAAKSAFSATKKFVDFAAPHVRSASVKAFDYSKQHATTTVEKVKRAHAQGDIRAPTLDEATDFAKSTSRRALGACIHAFDAVTNQIAAVANKSSAKPQKS